MDKKANIAIGYYKKILKNKIEDLHDVRAVNRDTFMSHITHSELNKLAQNKLISYEILHELNKHFKE